MTTSARRAHAPTELFAASRTAAGRTRRSPRRRRPPSSAPQGRSASATAAAATRRTPGTAAPITRRSSSRSLRRIHIVQPPADRSGDRKRDDQGRDAPAVPIDRPRFLDVAEPQSLDLGRHAFQPLQAMRPDQRMKARRRSRPRRSPAAAAASSRAGDTQASANISAPPTSASDSQTGDSASHTAYQLSFEAKTRKASAVAAAERDRIGAQPLPLLAIVDPEQHHRDPGQREIDHHLQPDRERQRAGNAERQSAAHALGIGDRRRC